MNKPHSSVTWTVILIMTVMNLQARENIVDDSCLSYHSVRTSGFFVKRDVSVARVAVFTMRF